VCNFVFVWIQTLELIGDRSTQTIYGNVLINVYPICQSVSPSASGVVSFSGLVDTKHIRFASIPIVTQRCDGLRWHINFKRVELSLMVAFAPSEDFLESVVFR